MQQEVLTLEQAAEYLLLTPDELRIELENKRIPGLFVAGKWRIKRDAIDRLLNSPYEQAITNVQPTNSEQSEIPRNLNPLQNSESGSVVNPTSYPSSLGDITATVVEENNLDDAQNVNEDTRISTSDFPLAPPKGRVWGRVYVCNPDRGYAYARLPDNRRVWLSSQHFASPGRIPFPGDTVEFELYYDLRKGFSGRQITIVEPANQSQTNQNTLISISKPKESRTHTQETQAAILEPVRKTTPSSINTPIRGTRQAQQYYQKAALARTEGRDGDARKLFRQAIEAGAGIEVYTAFFKMESEKGAKADARRIIQEAIAKFPDHPAFYEMYAQMERRTRNYERAEAIFRAGLQRSPSDFNLNRGLAQTLVQIGTESSFREAGKIFDWLEKKGKLDRNDRLYHRFKALQRSPSANRAYEFFQTIGMRVGIAGRRDLPPYITDLVVETNDQTLGEAFGVSGALLIRCFNRKVDPVDILNLSKFLRDIGSQDTLGLQDGREVVLNPSVAFIVVPSSDSVRDQLMSILGENREAIVPLDDFAFQNNTEPRKILHDLLGQYLGHRDLYASAMPVSGRRFFGRDRLLYQLTDEIHRGQFLGIYGLRKMGKTSLIYQLRDEKLRGEAVAYADLQASHALVTKNCEPLYWELERDLYQRLVNSHPEAAQMLRLGKIERYSDVPQGDGLARLLFAEDLRSFLDALAAGRIFGIKHLVIVLDELERILPITGQSKIEGYLEFFGLLRGLAQTERYRSIISSVVVAANAAVSDRGYWEGRENPVFALYKPVPLPPLSESECREMIVNLGKGMSVYWVDEAIQTIYSETGGHPFLTRTFCSQITKWYPTRPLTVTKEMAHEQITHFIRDEGDKLEQIVELLHTHFPDEERLLETIAFDQTPLDVSDESLRHLLSYSLVCDTASGYTITLNLLRRWLRRRAGIRD